MSEPRAPRGAGSHRGTGKWLCGQLKNKGFVRGRRARLWAWWSGSGSTPIPSDIFKVIARFETADGAALTGPGYTVTLSDEDRFFDDKLGTSKLSADGTAEFLIFVADILSFDSRGERTPDLYFVLHRDGKEIFRSEVFHEVNFDVQDPVTGRSKSLTQSFGPFRVPAG